MLKQYVIWQLKKWWPLILIISLALALPFVSIAQSASLVTTYFKNTSGYGGYGGYYGGSGLGVVLASLMVLGILGMTATFIVPVFVFVYRTSLQAVDCFYQAGFEKRTIRRARMLLGLGIVMVSFLIAFLMGLFVLGMRYLATPEVVETATRVDTRLNLNFGYIILAGLFLMLFIGIQYCINCFFASLGDSALVQIFLMLCGFAIMSLGVVSPTLYFFTASSFINPNAYNPTFETSYIGWCFGPIGVIGAMYEFLAGPIGGTAYVWPNYAWRYVVCLVGTVALGAGAVVWLVLAGEPSGESAGHWKPRNVYISLIPHVAALVIGIILGVAMGSNSRALTLIGGYAMVLFYCVAYYALLSLMRKSFKPTKLDLIFYLSVVGTVLAVTMSMTGFASYAAGRNYSEPISSSSSY